MSHYAQSPLSAIHGYLDMLGDTSYRKLHPTIIRDAQTAAERAQHVMRSIALAQKHYNASAELSPGRLDELFARLSAATGIRFVGLRKRPLPLVMVGYDALSEGLLLMVRQFTQPNARRVVVRFEQRKTDLIVHLDWQRVNREQYEYLCQLTRLGSDRYPLAPGEFMSLATGFVLLRSAGARMVTRQHVRRRSVHLHLAIIQQMSLVDVSAELR